MKVPRRIFVKKKGKAEHNVKIVPHLQTETVLIEINNVLESMGDAFFMLDKQWRFIKVNHVQEKVSQTKREDTLGKSFWKVFPATAKRTSKYWIEYHKVVKLKQPSHFTEYYEPLDIYTEVDAYPTEDGGISVFFRDITERKRAEDALFHSEERFRTLIEESTDAIQLVSPEGKILYTSASIKNVLGYTPDELSGMGVAPFMHPEDLEYFNKKLAEVVKNPKKPILLHYRVKHKDGSWAWLETTGVNHLKTPKINALVGTFRNITERKKAEQEMQYQKSLLEAQQEVSPLGILVVSSEGKMVTYNNRFAEMWKFPTKVLDTEVDAIALKAGQEQLQNPDDFIKRVQYLYKHKEASYEKLLFKDGRIFDRYGSPVLGENGNYFGYVWFFMDITERENLVKQKDDFLGIASHELKTPVTSVKAYTQMLERRFIKSNDKQSAELVSKMDAQLNKLTMLIADLLDVTKIESGRLQFNISHFNFNELVTETVEEIQRTTEKHTIKVKLGKNSEIYADRERIGQVLTNLLTNAIKYSPHADKIVVGTSSTKNDVTLCVHDFGVGISKDKQGKVFERFYRVSGPKQDTFPGLGLGLYISAEIIKCLGGKIWVESIQGKGSTFSITLPQKKIKENGKKKKDISSR